MKSNDSTTYYLIFDTNALYQTYDKKADFTTFSFNSTYENTIDMINQLDIYNRVTLVIPSVVWSEMEKQIVDKHDELLVQYKASLAKKKFPEFCVSETPVGDYADYIKTKIDAYKTDLSSGINSVIELPIASSSRFDSIVKRAFEKHPPFEGKEKKSDKGFKDALLWESILEFASTHSNSRIIYYSQDNAFGEFLISEFEAHERSSSLTICKNEVEVKCQLELWAKEIDKYSYQPITDYDENKAIIDWLNSGDFLVQVIDRDFGLVEKGRLIADTSVHLVSIENIENLKKGSEDCDYSVDAVLQINYQLKDGVMTSETLSVSMRIECIDDAVFSVEDIYKVNDSCIESED